jgi:hypothetical protein
VAIPRGNQAKVALSRGVIFSLEGRFSYSKAAFNLFNAAFLCTLR